MNWLFDGTVVIVYFKIIFTIGIIFYITINIVWKLALRKRRKPNGRTTSKN